MFYNCKRPSYSSGHGVLFRNSRQVFLFCLVSSRPITSLSSPHSTFFLVCVCLSFFLSSWRFLIIFSVDWTSKDYLILAFLSLYYPLLYYCPSLLNVSFLCCVFYYVMYWGLSVFPLHSLILILLLSC